MIRRVHPRVEANGRYFRISIMSFWADEILKFALKVTMSNRCVIAYFRIEGNGTYVYTDCFIVLCWETHFQIFKSISETYRIMFWGLLAFIIFDNRPHWKTRKEILIVNNQITTEIHLRSCSFHYIINKIYYEWYCNLNFQDQFHAAVWKLKLIEHRENQDYAF